MNLLGSTELIVAPTLTFFCPACATKLTVPASMAGVTGPCPVCSSTIQAPQPASPVPAIPIPAAPAAPPLQESPAIPVLSPPAPTPQPSASTPLESAVPILTPSQLPAPSGPTVVKVEPRSSRQRAADAPEVVARPITEQYTAEPREYRPPPKSPSRLFSRLLISLLVITLMAAISIGLILYFRGQAEPTGAPSSASKTLKILPDEEIPKSPAIPRAPAVPSAVIPPAAPPESATKPSKAHPGIAAMAVLEKFLAAQTLADRLPLIDTRLSGDELEASVLAKPLPPNPQVAPDIQETHSTDGSIDMFYNVDFKTPGGKDSPQLILVRVHGDAAPKVIVDPFLDSFGGRLAAYAAAPSDKAATFQVVISAVAQTTSDRNVPDHGNKLRLKLMSRDNEKEIANAYFTKLSKIGEMITTDGSGFRYGQARTAKVTLQWNKTEDPQMPFLEAIDIKEFRWNP